MYSTMASQKAAKARQAEMAGGASGINMGETPEAARYKPVNFNEEQMNTVMGNLNAMPWIQKLMSAQNIAVKREDMSRAQKLIPGFKDSMRITGGAANSLLRGQLPFDDALDIVADRSGLTGAIGTPGTAAPATLRDLGLSRLDAIKSGSGLMQGMVSMAETVSPISRYSTGKESMLSPSDRIKMAMEQNQLIQQSDQSAFNLEAGISPTESTAAQIALSQRLGALGGGSTGTDVSGYASAAQALLSSLGTAFKGTGTGTGTGAGLNAAGEAQYAAGAVPRAVPVNYYQAPTGVSSSIRA